MYNNDDIAVFDRVPEVAKALSARLRSVIVGQHEVIDLMLVGALCHGHVLIEGVPGLAKTLLARTLASALGLEFKRIQFTPDMMPGDVTGAEILQIDPATGERTLRFSPGPIFANIVLADEVNRTPPKTQAALLEAMGERQVSVGGVARPMPAPFMVIATQNPIEQEGTYPLPEAQLDRFMLGVRMTYPKAAEERAIVARGDEIENALREESAHSADLPGVAAVATRDDLLTIRRVIGAMPASEHVVEYAVALARATRPGDDSATETIRRNVSWGAGPRSGQFLLLGAKCLAAMQGRPGPSADDVQRLAFAVLAHRLVLSYSAVAEGVDAASIVRHLLEEVDQPTYR